MLQMALWISSCSPSATGKRRVTSSREEKAVLLYLSLPRFSLALECPFQLLQKRLINTKRLEAPPPPIPLLTRTLSEAGEGENDGAQMECLVN